jgi:AraC family transcriptional regulator
LVDAMKKRIPKHGTARDYRKRVCAVMNDISGNLDRDLSLKEIAAAPSFFMFNFHRIFESFVGETIAEFTRRLRLELVPNRLIRVGYRSNNMMLLLKS